LRRLDCEVDEVMAGLASSGLVGDWLCYATPGDHFWIQIEQAGIVARLLRSKQSATDTFDGVERETRFVSIAEIASVIACDMSS
jgi:hypothetical protein